MPVPTDIAGCQLWLDADDTATITHIGGAVSQWNDKSGNARHVKQATGGAQPSTGTRTVNGRNVIDYVGGRSLVADNFDLDLHTNKALTVFAVAVVDVVAASTTSGFFVSLKRSGLEDYFSYQLQRYGSVVSTQFGQGTGGPSQYIQREFPNTSVQPMMLTSMVQASGSDSRMRYNSIPQGVVTGGGTMPVSNFMASGTALHKVYVGCRATTGAGTVDAWLDGAICELIVYNTLLSDAQIATVEGYLASRWAIALPSGGVPLTIPNLTAWYDADDAVTITDAGAGAVSQWLDKSGNAKHVTQATAGSQPTRGTVTQNGRNTLNFDGGDWLSRTSDVLPTAFSVFVVARATTSTRKVAVSQASTASGLGPTHRLGMEGGGVQWYIFQQDSGTVNATLAGAVDLTGSCRVWRWTDTGSNATQCVDGGAGQTVAYTRGAYNPNNFRLGSLGMSSNQDFWAGPICEVIIYSRVLTAAEIVQVESYLSAKWGTSGPRAIPGCQLWLDASDAASITDAGAGAVSQWSDKSGAGRHVTQALGSARPTTGVATANGKNMLDFDGGDYLAYAGGTGVDLDAMTMFVVFREDTTVINSGIVTYHSGVGDDFARFDSFSFGTGDANNQAALGRAAVNALLSGTGVSTLSLWRATCNGTSISVHKWGAAGTPASTGGTYVTPTGGIVIGARYLSGAVDASYRLNGQIAEIIVYDTVLSAGNIIMIENYLQAKWFLTPVAGIPNVRSWLDASDPTTIVGSPNVTMWTDKSGLGLNATSVSGTPVTGVATLNGKNGLRFTSDRMAWTSTTAAWTVFAVARRETSTSGVQRLLSSYDGSGALTAAEYLLDWTGTAAGSQWRFFRGTAGELRPAQAHTSLNIPLVVAARTGALGGYLRINGSIEGATATAYSTGTSAMQIGCDIDNTEFWEGDVFEFILYDRELTDVEMLQVEQYLMTKWNIGLRNIPGLVAQYDASVASSITDAGAGAVSQWSDISGQDRHLTQAQPGERPTTGVATINGRNAITFDGTSDHLDRLTPFLAGLINGHSVFIVAKSTATGTRVLVGEGHTSQTNSAVRQLILAGDACQINVDDDSNATRYAVNAGDLFDGNAHLTTWLDSRTLASIQIDAGTPVSSGGYVRGTVTTTKFSVGAMGRATPTLFWQGQICEILIFNGVLSAADITTVKNYLNTKWFVPPLPVGVGQWTEEDDVLLGVGASLDVVIFDVEFSQPVTGFTDEEVTLSGTALPTAARVVGSDANYAVLVTGMSVDGTVIASIPAGVAQNADGEDNLASTSIDNEAEWSRPPVTGAAYTLGTVTPVGGGSVSMVTSSYGGYIVHTFTHSGTTSGGWTMELNFVGDEIPGHVDFLIVGGGGGGGSASTGNGSCGGGGGGEVTEYLNQPPFIGTTTIVVGNGGGNSTNGTDTTIKRAGSSTPDYEAWGGAGGGQFTVGGESGHWASGAGASNGAFSFGTPGRGHDGRAGGSGLGWGGGGGGAGGVGFPTPPAFNPRDGGPGKASLLLNGTPIFYGGGGAGGGTLGSGWFSGGVGGGGATQVDGAGNSGGGGGAGQNNFPVESGRAGGYGAFIIRYPGSL